MSPEAGSGGPEAGSGGPEAGSGGPEAASGGPVGPAGLGCHLGLWDMDVSRVRGIVMGGGGGTTF